MTSVAVSLGRYKFVDEKILNHVHPAYGKAHMDEQYVKTEAFYTEDGNTFNKRRAKNFDL